MELFKTFAIVKMLTIGAAAVVFLLVWRKIKKNADE